MAFPKEIQELSEVFSNLPSVVPKLSSRLALYLSINAKDLARKLSHSLDEAVKNIKVCKRCGNVTNGELCDICLDENRDQGVILVLEDALDLANLEATREYSGVYHVSGGVISPINGIGPEELSIDKLLERLKDPAVKEIILCLNPNVEGDATSLYIKNEAEKARTDVKITRLAKGIPAGSGLEFISGQTIVDSIKSRVSF